MSQNLKTDYLVIGSGAVGMAFVDVLLDETDANIIIVDKHHKPGGHWNDAYSFVTLHQPSAFYGVSSTELSKNRLSKIGLNKGLGELATGPEIMSYYSDLMYNRYLPTGRVQYFPMCDYQGDKRFVSMLSGEEFSVTVNKKIVDATYFRTSVPSTHTPQFDIEDGADLKPLNALPDLKAPREGYVVVGGGKTGIDAVIWLLENQVNPDDIRWIMPRDAWLWDRQNTQPSAEFFTTTIGAQAAGMEALAKADSIPDLYDRLEKSGVLVRIDTDVEPRMFHGATISQAELTELRRVKNIIRMGRVTTLGKDEIILEHGTIPTSPGILHIDCSASAVPPRRPLPVFDGDTITIQTVRTVQPVFSAAFIAHLEAAYDDEAKKASLCGLVPLPNHATDWLYVTAGQMQNQFKWAQEPGIREWLLNNRLDGFTAMVQSVKPDDQEKMQILGKMREYGPAAAQKVQQFIGEVEAAKAAGRAQKSA